MYQSNCAWVLGGAVALLVGASSQAAVTYVDATSGVGGNTTLADGSTFTPPLNGTTGADNNWEQRTVFGSGGNIFETAGEAAGASENGPELRTTISGLTVGAQYTIYTFLWDPTSTNEDWSLRAGFTANPGANTLYSAADSTGELSSTAAGLASDLTYATAPTILAEGGRALLAAALGTATANGSGEILVYIDDRPAGGSVNNRSWYDGVGYELVPEPASLAMVGLGGLCLLARRRR